MTNFSNYINSKISKKELFPDIRLFADKYSVPIVSLDTALFLDLLVKIKNPSKILEVGAAIGYSTLYLLEHFQGEKLTTIELSKDNIEHLKRNLPADNRIEIIQDDALSYIPNKLSEGYDLIFIDAGKKDYQRYFELLKDKLNIGGIMVYDNIFWRGAVTGNPIKERYMRAKDAIVAFTDKFLAEEQFVTTIINIGDGLVMGVKNG